jgi:N-methylhydantoinase B
MGENGLDGAALPAKVSLELAEGDVVTVRTPGGGGWGEAVPTEE